MATTISEKALKSYLVDFGLNDKEISIYISLLQAGPSTIMDLSRKTSIKRSTTHNNVEELIKKGLVSQTNYGERRMVIAEDPEKLKFLLEQRKWDVQKLEKVMPELVSTIYEMVPQAKTNSKVDVKYYEGKSGVSTIYKEAFNTKELRSYVNLAAVHMYFPENSEIFLAAQKKNKNLKVMELIDGSDESLAIAKEFGNKSSFSYKSIPKTFNLSHIDILIFDNKVCFINFSESSLKGTVIENADYFKHSVEIFDLLWGTLS
jgi:sugar-specific transcriptional regulator TrmB